jgi:hypothetical protein
MAYLRTAAALRRIRQVVEQSLGNLRTTPTGRFGGESPTGLADESILAKAVDRPRVETTITSITPSAATPPVIGNIRIYDVMFAVKVTRIVTPLEQVSDADRDALMALAAEDVDVLGQALGFPGNLASTAAGTATDIISGLLVPREARITVRRAIDEGAQPIDTVVTMLGRLISRPEVTSVEPTTVLNGTDTVLDGLDTVLNGA